MNQTRGIEKFSPFYYLLKKYVDVCFRLFYKVRYINKDGVPVKGKLIFAGNHQNALMDALAILTSFNWQPVFLGRSDIFRNKSVAGILRFFKMVPVYRIRDGFDQLSNNQESFEQTFRVLDYFNPIVIFPEGNHLGVKRIRSFKKGIARIAFDYLTRSVENKDLAIIPVGLTYTDYHKSGSPLYISFGEKIMVSDFADLYKENPARAYLALLEEIGNQIKKQTLHIEHEDAYSVIDTLLDIPQTPSPPSNRLKAWQQIISQAENLYSNEEKGFSNLIEQTRALNQTLESQNLSSKDLIYISWASVLKRMLAGLSLLISLPVFLYAWLQILIPNLILKNILSKVKDPHFKSSVRFVSLIFLFPVFFLLQTLLVGLLTGSWLLTGVYLLTLLASPFLVNRWKNILCSILKGRKMRPIKRKVSDILEQIDSWGILQNP